MSEIEDFLRKAAQRRKDRKKKSPLPPPPESDATPSMPSLQSRPPLQSMPVQPASPAPHEMLTTRNAVESSVDQHIDTSTFGERAADIAHDIELSDDRMEEHLHDKFDHSVGNLQETASTHPRQKAGTNVIANLFANPQSIRQAFIMSEVMRPVSARDDEAKRS